MIAEHSPSDTIQVAVSYLNIAIYMYTMIDEIKTYCSINNCIRIFFGFGIVWVFFFIIFNFKCLMTPTESTNN